MSEDCPQADGSTKIIYTIEMTSEFENHKQSILYCPHCGNTSVQTHIVEQPYDDKYYGSTSGDIDIHPSLYNVVRCETCSEILVYSKSLLFPEDAFDTNYGDLVYPKQTAFNSAVPERVRKIYLEAAKVKNISPIAFAVLSRRVLEEIAHDKGVNERNLASALTELVNRGDIPPVLAEATTLVRLIGNAGAHASEMDITTPQVWSIDDFIKAIIEYLYVAPAKIVEFKRSAANLGVQK